MPNLLAIFVLSLRHHTLYTRDDGYYHTRQHIVPFTLWQLSSFFSLAKKTRRTTLRYVVSAPTTRAGHPIALKARRQGFGVVRHLLGICRETSGVCLDLDA